MTITATTRRCGGCRELLEAGAPACPSCGRIQTPPHAEWPKGFKRWLVLRILAAKVAAMVGATQQTAWERALRDVALSLPGVRSATPVAELYPRAIEAWRAWWEAGQPPIGPFTAGGDNDR